MKTAWAVLLALISGNTALAFTTTDTPLFGTSRATVDMPGTQHMRNMGGSDGEGLCVYTSIEVAGRWQNEDGVASLQAWAHKRPGGSYPKKLAEDLKEFAPDLLWVQSTGGDEAFLRLAFRTRRAPCITYAGDDNFYHEPIAHMVTGAALDDTNMAVVDNNRPGHWVWDTRERMLNRWKGLKDDGTPYYVRTLFGWMRLGGGWVVVLLSPPPPPETRVDPVPPPKPTPDPSPSGRWESRLYNGNQVYWFYYDQTGRLLWVYRNGQWYKARGQDRWDARPSPAPSDVPPPPNTPGVQSHLVDQDQHYYVNGYEVSREVACTALMVDVDSDGVKLVDDSDRYHLTVVVKSAWDRNTLLSFLLVDPRFAEYAARVHLQVYTEDAWPVRSGRVGKGITIQDPAPKGGKVLVSLCATETPTVECVFHALKSLEVR